MGVARNDYTYRGLIAATWDLSRETSGRWQDADFYLGLVQEFGTPVLDVGCGSGRIALDYAAQGLDVDGVDNSPELLVIMAEKARSRGLHVGIAQQPMQLLSMPRRYRTILVPSCSFQLVTDATEARATMDRLFQHLSPGGALVVRFGYDWQPTEPLDRGWQLAFTKVRPEDGAVVTSWLHQWAEPENRFWHLEQRFEVRLGDELIENELHTISPEMKWYSQEQACELFAESGFGGIMTYAVREPDARPSTHEYTSEPARLGDRNFCVLGVRPLE